MAGPEDMTIRDHLNRKMRPFFIVMGVCFVLFALSGPLAASMRVLPLLPFIPFLGFAGCILYLYFRIRCPNCNNPISQLPMMAGGGFFRFSRKLKCCPFCGIDFDTELKDLPGTAQ